MIAKYSLEPLDGEPSFKYHLEIITAATECDKNIGRLKFYNFRLDSSQAKGSIKRLDLFHPHKSLEKQV